MSLSINVNSNATAKKNANIHNIHCDINFNGEAKVEEFFTNAVRDDETGLSGSIRGRPLDGTRLDIPEKYVGLVLKEKRKPLTEDEDREVDITHQFNQITYWNLDSKPNCNDAIQTAMQWPRLAKAIHDEID